MGSNQCSGFRLVRLGRTCPPGGFQERRSKQCAVNSELQVISDKLKSRLVYLGRNFTLKTGSSTDVRFQTGGELLLRGGKEEKWLK